MIQFIKTRQVKNPERVVGENAGIDVYIPDNTPDFRRALLEKNGLQSFEDAMDPDFFSNKYTSISNAIDYCVNYKLSYMTDKAICIAPHRAIIIPTGLKSKFGPELALIANNKSGIATKKQLIFGASVIDASYQGEWHINLINTSDSWQSLDFGQKAVQFIPHLISTDELEVLNLTEEEFYTEKTSRGEGWAGSTGVK